MQYRYAEKWNFEDYASGRVFYARPGQPAFPVRLTSEIFQRALAHWHAAGGRGRCSIYDPVCGGAYWLTALAYLHWDAIAAIYASDSDIEILQLAERNLSLMTLPGLEQRMAEIETMLAAYQKESHASALVSVKKFHIQLGANLGSHIIEKKVFQANASDSAGMAHGLGTGQVDLVLADVPYGWHSEWRGANAESGMLNDELRIAQTPVWRMLEALHHLLKPGGIVTVVVDKAQKVTHEKYRRLERFQLGKRRIFILAPQ